MRRSVCSGWVTAALFAACASARPMGAQSRVGEPFVALAALVQSAPTTTEAGLQVSVGGHLPVAPGLALRTSVELARTSVLSTVDRCDFVAGSTACFERPSHETLAALALSLVIAPGHAASWHPRATLGLGWLRSFGDAVAGQRRQLLTPEASVGLARQAWGVDLRVRRLDRWNSSAHAQVALHMFRTL
ncbi:MAG: hypothetical protein IPK33_11810 [Gemmatimonadetes bacterium]|jgi:hypothetical protein|nr:hypothetical protein [Gemmatimonadota bacterium]